MSDVFLDSRFSLRVGRAVQSQLGHPDRDRSGADVDVVNAAG